MIYAPIRTEQGFAAIAAIFLVVILAALGAFMLTFSNTQQLTSAQDIQGTRAYWAARAGLEFGIGTVVSASACPTNSLTLVDGFTLTVTCESQTYTEAGSSINIFRITSVALTGNVGSIGYVERSVSASLER